MGVVLYTISAQRNRHQRHSSGLGEQTLKAEEMCDSGDEEEILSDKGDT